MREQDFSRTYRDDLDEAWRMVSTLAADGWPVARLVIRARTLYREAWRKEQVRFRNEAS